MTAPAPRTAPGPHAHARVLLVDDERDMLDLSRDLLEAEGYTVATAESGEEALAALGRAPFDVVITDLRMPGMGGLEALAHIRRLDPNLPVIVVSGYLSDECRARCRGDGAFECLQKPVDLALLLHRLAAACDRRRDPS